MQLKPADRQPLVEEVTEKIRLGCAINRVDSNLEAVQKPPSFNTQALFQDPPGKAEGSKQGLNVTADLNASAQTPESDGEPAEGQSQPAGKRKHEPEGLDVATTPTESVEKRPRLESGTSQAGLGEGEDSESHSDDPSKASLPFASSCYLINEDNWANDKQAEDSTGTDEDPFQDGQAETTPAESSPEELPLTRTMGSGADPAARTVKRLLRDVDQCGLLQYIECTHHSDTIKRGRGDTFEFTGTSRYYERMATDSLRMLYEHETTNTRTFETFTKVEADHIIEEVFVCLFPNVFRNLVDALATARETHRMEHASPAASPANQEVYIPEGVLEVQGIQDEITMLEFKELGAKIRRQNLLVRLRTIYNALMDRHTDISRFSADLKKIIQEVKEHMSTKNSSSARKELAEVLFPDAKKGDRIAKLDRYTRKSDVVFALAQAFSIGCIWADPTPHATVWGDHRTRLGQIFDIIKQCDPEDRVHKICRSLKVLTEEYTDRDPSLKAYAHVLDKLEEDPLLCINELMLQVVRVPDDNLEIMKLYRSEDLVDICRPNAKRIVEK